jgi:hypothetical protein
MIQMTRQGLSFSGADADLELLKRDFERRHYLLLKDFLHPEIASLLLPFLKRAKYSPAQYKRVGSEFLMEPNLALDTLSFLTNDMKLFSLIQTITDCGSIGCFQGRIYKLIPDPQHIFDWHNDLHDESRLIAMSINLSAGMYRGGLLQIREVRSGKIAGEVANTGFGSAVLFRISEDLEHRVTGIQGDAPRTSFAGWFKSGPSLYSQVKQSLAGPDRKRSKK